MPSKYKIHDQSGIQIILSPLKKEMDNEHGRQQAEEVQEQDMSPALALQLFFHHFKLFADFHCKTPLSEQIRLLSKNYHRLLSASDVYALSSCTSLR
ncbi:hypothetical protein SDC9_69127 [bioreactor metagenome]|uniref:Uncharacterized protein n=1 Tax=bioreactor metagenome TaxID=1076179 RepID=A0A644Y2U4_9ZZZZ